MNAPVFKYIKNIDGSVFHYLIESNETYSLGYCNLFIQKDQIQKFRPVHKWHGVVTLATPLEIIYYNLPKQFNLTYNLEQDIKEYEEYKKWRIKRN